MIVQEELEHMIQTLRALWHGALFFAVCEPGPGRDDLMHLAEQKLKMAGREVLRATEPDFPERLEGCPIIFTDEQKIPEEKLLHLNVPVVFWVSWKALIGMDHLLAARKGLFCLEEISRWVEGSPEEIHHRVRILEEEIQREISASRLLFLHGEMAKLHAALGDYHHALETLKKFVNLAREFNDPAVLATGLNNLGHILFALGREKEALEVTEEAVKIYRELARTDPQAFLPYLAISLNN
ncbi:MAG: tetratricopeptide repeat protein, partial [Thermofilum sp.]